MKSDDFADAASYAMEGTRTGRMSSNAVSSGSAFKTIDNIIRAMGSGNLAEVERAKRVMDIMKLGSLHRPGPIDFGAFEPFKPVYRLVRSHPRHFSIIDQRAPQISFTCGYSEAVRRFAAFKVQKRLEGQDNPILMATMAQEGHATISLYTGMAPLTPMASGMIKVAGC